MLLRSAYKKFGLTPLVWSKYFRRGRAANHPPMSEHLPVSQFLLEIRFQGLGDYPQFQYWRVTYRQFVGSYHHWSHRMVQHYDIYIVSGLVTVMGLFTLWNYTKFSQNHTYLTDQKFRFSSHTNAHLINHNALRKTNFYFIFKANNMGSFSPAHWWTCAASSSPKSSSGIVLPGSPTKIPPMRE